MAIEITEVNMACAINKLSFGIWGYNLLKELLKRDIRVNLWPIGPMELEASWMPHLQKAINGQNDYNPVATSLKIWHAFDFAHHIGKGQSVGFTIFELDKLTQREKWHLCGLDKILVPSEWAKKVVIANLAETQYPASYVEKRTFVVPLGIDPDIFFPASINGRNNTQNTVFLNVGKWEIRKGHDVLLEAFNKAFEPSDNVELWMCPTNPFIDSNPWIKKYKSSKLGDKVTILDRVDTAAQMAELYNYVDCGVFPARAEGWCLPAHEMMACGKPVIITNCTGQSEWVTKESCLLIDMPEFDYEAQKGYSYSFATPSAGMEFAHDPPFFKGQGAWLKFGDTQMEQLIEYMRNVHKNQVYPNYHTNIKDNCIEQARKFTWKNSVDYLLKALEK